MPLRVLPTQFLGVPEATELKYTGVKIGEKTRRKKMPKTKKEGKGTSFLYEIKATSFVWANSVIIRASLPWTNFSAKIV